VGHAIEIVVDLLPSELWNPFVVSELGFDGDVLEIEIEVPLRVTDLEVVASSGHWRNVAPLVLVLPARKFKPSLGCLRAENEKAFVVAILLPSDEESTSSWIALEVASWSFNVLVDRMHRELFAVMPVFELPVRMLELEEAPVICFLSDIEFGESSLWSKEPPVRLFGEVLNKLGA